MKKQKLLNNLKHRLSLLLCLMAFLTVGQSAWGTTFTIQGNDYYFNELSWTSKNMTDIGNNTFTYSITAKNSGTNQGQLKFWRDGATLNSSQILTLDVEKNFRVGYSEPDYTYNEFLISSITAGSTYTVQLDNSDNDIKITILSGSGPTPSADTWTVRGEFNNWAASSDYTFTGSGNSLSFTKSFAAGQTYPGGQKNKGFKIVKSDGTTSTWYGSEGNITRSNNTAAFSTELSSDTKNCGFATDLAGNYTFTITNLTGNPELTITYPQSTYAIARWGDAPTIDGDKDIDASAYVATHGCNGSTNYEVTQLRVRYWKEGDVANAEVIETEEGTYDPGTAYPITIPYTSNVLINCTTESKIIMEVAAKNDLGWSSYSDRMAVMYTAGTTFVTHNLEKSFTACEGNHQFTLSEMVGPVPGSWAVVTSGGADAKSEFTLADGEMIWNPGDKTTGTYIYTFTFSKEGGYVDKSATLTINYTKTVPEGAIGDISASPSGNVSKFTPVTLSATMGTGVTKIKWSVTPNTFITETDANHATFQGKAVTKYTVTAVGLSESCGETAAKTKQITVTKDTEECNE